MLSFILSSFVFGTQEQLLTDLNTLAEKRDIASLARLSAPSLNEDHFQYLKRGGVYGAGRAGWKVFPLKDVRTGQDLVVFSSNIGVEDLGEQVYVVSGGKLSRHLDEIDPLGWSAPAVDLAVSFAPKDRKAFLQASFRLKSKDASRPLLMRLSPHYKVLSATQGGKPVAFAQAGGVISLKAAPASEPVVLSYEAVLTMKGSGASIEEDEAMLTNDFYWPHIARQTVTGVTTIKMPKDWYGITVGTLTSDKQTPDGMRTMVYKNSVPVCYLSLSAGKFKVVSVTKNGRTLGVISRVMTQEQMQLQAELYEPIFDYFSTIKPHPYPAFYAVVTDLFEGGALEAYSYATYQNRWLPDEEPHEPGHTWWGGMIPNTYLRSLWNESFAVFGEGLYRREGPIGKIEDKRLAFVQKADANPYSTFPLASAGADKGGSAVNLGYEKGGKVLQQLEFEAGRETMKGWLKEWQKSHPKGALGEWENFEAVCGPKWKPFFDQWVRRAGWPKFTISNDLTVEAKSDGSLMVSRPVTFEKDTYDMAVEGLAGGSYGTKYVKGAISGSKLTYQLPKGTTWMAVDPLGRIIPFGRSEPQPTWERGTRGLTVVVDPAHKDWAGSRKVGEWDGTTLDGHFFIGHPDTMPVIKKLLGATGIKVSGNTATLRGVSVNLDKGQAVALVTLTGGGKCAVLLGKARRDANMGSASLGLADDLGRFLVGDVEPRKSVGYVEINTVKN